MRGQATACQSTPENYLPSPPHLTLTLQADRRSPTTTPKNHDRVSRELPIQSTYNTNQLSRRRVRVVSNPNPPVHRNIQYGNSCACVVCVRVSRRKSLVNFRRRLAPRPNPDRPQSRPSAACRPARGGSGTAGGRWFPSFKVGEPKESPEPIRRLRGTPHAHSVTFPAAGPGSPTVLGA